MIKPKKIRLPIFPNGLFIFSTLIKVLSPKGITAKTARSIPTRPSPAIKPEQNKIPFSEVCFFTSSV